MRKPKELIYDIETSPLPAYVWHLGKQVVRHNQLQQIGGKPARHRIISAAWVWNDGSKPESIDWDFEKQDDTRIVKTLDKLINEADVVIGKNSNSFDNKYLNMVRMFAGLPGNPAWLKYTEDLETHMRKNFYLPSYSLDYISEQLGLGGKMKMEFNDWVSIIERRKEGKKALAKMVKYNKKDVADTREVWNYCKEHFTPKTNFSSNIGENGGCIQCGSTNLMLNGTRQIGQTIWQAYRCKACHKYAGRAPISKGGKVGKVRAG